MSDRPFVLHKAGHSSKAAIKSGTFSPVIPLTWTPTPSPADVSPLCIWPSLLLVFFPLAIVPKTLRISSSQCTLLLLLCLKKKFLFFCAYPSMHADPQRSVFISSSTDTRMRQQRNITACGCVTGIMGGITTRSALLLFPKINVNFILTSSYEKMPFRHPIRVQRERECIFILCATVIPPHRQGDD